jgi:hypothetical protein
MKDRANIDRAKELLPMTALLKLEAPDWREKNPVRDDKHGNSFSVTPEDNGWNDNATGDKGDQIDFLERRKGLNTADATKLFLEIAGVATAHKNGHAPKSKPVTAKVDWPACVNAFTDDQVSKLAAWRGLTVEFVQWLKLRALVGSYEGKLALPEHDPETGTLTGVHYLVGKPEDKKWIRLKDTVAQPLIIGNRTAKKWILSESQWDVFCVMAALDYHLPGYEPSYAILVTRGSGNGKFASVIPSNAEAIVIMQNDEEKNGRIASDDWLEDIKRECPARLKVARPPADFKDCNDWLKRGIADFNGMLAKAEAVAKKGLPEIQSWDQFEAEVIPEPTPLVHGVLDVGAKMVLGGGSKSFKSWVMLMLALAVALGVEWMGFPCSKGRVLYINLEIRPFYLRKRIRSILAARGLPQPDNLDVWNLRGHAQGIEKLRPMIEAKIGTGYAMVIIDPAYKILGERVENSNEDMAIVLNEIERLAVNSGAAVVVAAHFSKGNQSGKSHLDRVSGAGAWARDPDVFMTMTPHETEDCLTVETTLRDHKPVDAFVVEWNHPLTVRRDELDPEKLKQVQGRPALYKPEDVLETLVGEMTATEWQRAANKKTKVSRAKFYEIRAELEESGLVQKAAMTGKYWRSTK